MMLRTVLISALLLSVTAVCRARADEPTDAEGYVERGQERALKGEYEQAIADFTKAIGLDPRANYYVCRGWGWHQSKKYDKAIADYDKAVELEATNASAYLYRGISWTERNQIEKALDDFDRAVKLDPKNAMAYRGRAEAWSRNGDFKTAIAAYDKAIELDPTDPVSWNDRAWLEATCPDATIRNGKLAVEHATKACEVTGWKKFDMLDTLAAACAEAGDFANAVKWQTTVCKAAPASDKAEFQARLNLYKAHHPYRDTAKSK
jgi:tetratricopeptide (TPR) repeat protein